MNEGLIPSRYAKALYKYAQEHHVAAPIYEEMKRLDAAFATHTELSKALSNPALSAADKVRVLSSAFGEKPDDYLLRFVQLVIRNRRETFARAIALAYQDIYRRANHIARVTIITAVALDSIRKKFFKRFSQVIILIPYLLSTVIISYIVYAFLSGNRSLYHR
mgnify:CR=1 FL=1